MRNPVRLHRASGSDPTRFVGREQELSALRLLYESAQKGRAGFAMVQGPPGMGKTTLLNHLLDGLDDARVVRANGVEPESDLEFGVVDQLLREADATPAGLPGGDHLRAGTLLLEAIDALETRTPVVVAIEDCHWVDQSSLRAVLFAVRRMVSERVLCVLTLRPEGLDRLPTGLRALAERFGGVTVRLEPLTDDEVRLLAAARDTTISARAIRRLHEHTGGSPLYASALLDEVPADRWDTFEERWPAPRSYAALVQRRVAALTPAARDLLQSCSVLGVSCSVDMASMLCEVDRPLEAVEEAAHTGLLTFDHATADQLRFDHPLSRVAVYHGIGLATRARLHARAASLMGSPFEALRHRVAATVGADDNLARELEQSAAAASSTGAWSTVASLLAYASRLSSDDAERGRRLLEAGEAALYSSERERVRRLLPVLEQLEPSSLRDGVLAFAAITNGRGDDAERLLASAWSLCNPERDGLLAAKICERRAFLGVLRMRPSEAVEWGSRAVELSPDNDVTVSLSTWTLALGLDQTGRRDEALALIDEGVVRLGAALRAGAYPLADVRGACLLAADRLVEAREALEVAAPLQVQHGVLTKASLAYSRLARVAFASGTGTTRLSMPTWPSLSPTRPTILGRKRTRAR